MSHFTVLVALPPSVTRETLDDRLTAALAPFDENREVEPYREYEDGGPEDHWFVSAMRRAREELLVGAGIKPHQPDGPTFSTASSRETPEAQRNKQREDARFADLLGEHPNWPDVIWLMAERYGEKAAEVERLQYDADSDRAYTMSTYPKGAKWDYWRIGGRWRGYFPAAPGAAGDVLLSEKGWDSPESDADGRCDGGRKRHLDMEALRSQKAAEADEEWNAYAALVFGMPEALPWSIFRDKVDQSGNGGYSWDDARREYGEQARVKAARASDRFRHWFGDDPVELFAKHDRDQYAARAQARAVPGYATLDAAVDGHWLAPGRMGWFGAGSDDETSYELYVERANAFVDELPDDAWLVVVDCHI